jgi:hypothetical protein
MLRDDDREYLANQVMEDDGPDEIDPNLLRVIKDLTAAVKAIKAPVIPAFDMTPVAKAIASMPSVSDEIAGLRGDVQALAKVVSDKASPDLESITDAIRLLHATQKAIIAAMTAPKEIVFDTQGNPSGIRVIRPN